MIRGSVNRNSTAAMDWFSSRMNIEYSGLSLWSHLRIQAHCTNLKLTPSLDGLNRTIQSTVLSMTSIMASTFNSASCERPSQKRYQWPLVKAAWVGYLLALGPRSMILGYLLKVLRLGWLNTSRAVGLWLWLFPPSLFPTLRLQLSWRLDFFICTWPWP